MTNQLPITFTIPNTAGNKAYSDYNPDNRIPTTHLSYRRVIGLTRLFYNSRQGLLGGIIEPRSNDD